MITPFDRAHELPLAADCHAAAHLCVCFTTRASGSGGGATKPDQVEREVGNETEWQRDREAEGQRGRATKRGWRPNVRTIEQWRGEGGGGWGGGVVERGRQQAYLACLL
jgi:hypothetical protein